jgi:transposase
MGAVIPAGILGYEGQVIKEVRHDEATGKVTVICRRDRRHRPVDARCGRAGSVNRWLRRTVRDVPLGGRPCEVEIEYAQVFLSPSCVRVEALPFVVPGTRATRRFARLVSGLCRHMPIDAVARHTGLSWHSVKALDAASLIETVVPPRPGLLSGIRYLGVDEVARAKGHDYVTLVYDLTPGEHCGRILWVKEGRDAATLLEFLDALSQECADGIEAVAIDMGLAYIAAVQKGLPSAAIVFDRFHVMQMFSKVIRDCRRAQFKEAKKLDDLTGQQSIKGSLWLLLSNRNTLKDSDRTRLDQLLTQNQPLATLYALKEQLQRLWHQPISSADMAARLDDWCGLATAAKITGLAKFVKTLQSHRSGICAYADHPITTARLEAGNVSIGLLRRRARGFRDTEYLKLKIYQLNTPDTPSFLYANVPAHGSENRLSTV